MKSLIVGIILCLCLAVTAVIARNLSVKAIELNNQGVDSLKKETSYPAYKSFVAALAEDPFNLYVQLNLGLAFLLNKEPDKAVKTFGTVVRLAEANPELQFYGFFNAAVALTQEGQIEAALQNYQNALELRPDSVEVKTNIELLWQGGGQGKGKGEGKDKKDDPNGKEKGEGEGKGKDKRDQSKDQQYENSKPTKQKLGGGSLTKEQIQAILEELKNQEQKIRAEENEQGLKEAPNGKDW
jgi:tetratricopeptide (TPR) repeat protein